MEDHKTPPPPTPDEEKGVPEYPRVFEVNAHLQVRVGYRDCRIVVTYNTGLPVVGRVDLTLDPPDIPRVEKVIERQRALKAKTAAERKKMKPEELRLSKRTVACVGFEDNRVELAVSLFITTYRIPLKDDEAPRVGEALTFAKEWNARPEVERFLQGAE